MDSIPSSITAQEDAELIGRLRRRDPAAACELCERYGGLLFSLMLNIVGDRQDAEDLLAELLLKASNRLQMCKTNDFALRPWLLILARNHALRFRAVNERRERAGQADNLESPALFAATDTFDDEALTVAAACKAFLNLTEVDRLILELAWFEGMSFEEISLRVHLPLSEVMSAAKDSLARIRE